MSLIFSGTFKLLDACALPLLNWRRLLPQSVRLAYHIAKGNLRDLQTGNFIKFALPSRIAHNLPIAVELEQPIITNAWLQNKLSNIRLASRHLNAVTLQPGQVFSFWKTIGNPTERKGYKKGRNIVHGQIQETIGGGLCQLSGIIYHTSLIAGLAILERHNHSIDLYANGEPRFTPLGADATVAYGYKDLRVKNPFDFAVRFEVEVVGEMLVCRLRSEEKLSFCEIEFQANTQPGSVEVATMKHHSDGHFEVVGKSVYRVL